jgi:hypothetical protein
MEKPIVLYIYNNNNNYYNYNYNYNRRHIRPYTLRHQDASFLLTRRHRQNIHPKLCAHLKIPQQNFPEEGSSRPRSLTSGSTRSRC